MVNDKGATVNDVDDTEKIMKTPKIMGMKLLTMKILEKNRSCLKL